MHSRDRTVATVSRVATVLVLVGAWGWSFQRQLLALHTHHLNWAHDAAFFRQILHSAVNGGPWASPLLLEPQGMFEMVHFHPVLPLVVALYALIPHLELLLGLNVLAVVIAGWPLACIAERVSKRAWMAPVAALAFVIWLPTISAAQADFRPMSLMVAGFAWVALGLVDRKWGPLLAGAALCVLAREEAGYLLAWTGVVGLIWPKRWKHGLALLGVGVGWLLVLLVIKENLFFHFDPRSLAGDRPEIPQELRAVRWEFAWRAGLSGYALAPLSPVLAMGAAPTGFLWMDGHREWTRMVGPVVHLRGPSLALFAAAGTAGAAWAVRKLDRWGWVVAAAMVLGNAMSFWPQRASLRARQAAMAETLGTPESVALAALLERVQPNDRVVTDYGLIAALSGRDVLWNAVHVDLDEGPRDWPWAWPVTLEHFDVVVVPLEDPLVGSLQGWDQVAVGGGYGLWRNPAPVAGSPFE